MHSVAHHRLVYVTAAELDWSIQSIPLWDGKVIQQIKSVAVFGSKDILAEKSLARGIFFAVRIAVGSACSCVVLKMSL